MPGQPASTKARFEWAGHRPVRSMTGLGWGRDLPRAMNESKNALSTLDPQVPLVLDVHELGRRPGSQRVLTLSVPAPAGLGTEVLGVLEGSTLELQVRLEAVVEGVLASGVVQAELVGECVRCLEPIERNTSVEFQELYAYPDSDVEDDEASRLEGDLLDLEGTVRDAVILSLPFQPLCRDDCPGLCVRCGARLADEPEHRHEAEIDPRWSALARFLADEGSTEVEAPNKKSPDPSSNDRRDEGAGSSGDRT